MEKRFDRKFHVPNEGSDMVFISICPETGEIKECRDLVTLFQGASYDLVEYGHEIKFQVERRP